MTMTKKSFNLGIIDMLKVAIYDHQRAHDGASPKRFELHPAVVMDLETDRESLHTLMTRPDGNLTFLGVLVVRDLQATRPKLITINNQVAYL